MFGQNSAYYNETVRKNIVAFGSLFNQITIQRTDSVGITTEYIRVPIVYGPKEKFIYRLTSENGLSDFTHIQNSFPKMGFDISNIIFDPSRKINRLFTKKIIGQNESSVGYVGIPYNINFNLYVFTRNLDDNLQILEQIIPFFAPDFTVSINYNVLNQMVDVPIVMNDFNVVEDYESDFTTRRSVSGIYAFTMKTWIYGNIKNSTSAVIENANIRLYEGLTLTNNNPVINFGYTGDTGGNVYYYQNEE
jgi:hypothetical protein